MSRTRAATALSTQGAMRPSWRWRSISAVKRSWTNRSTSSTRALTFLLRIISAPISMWICSLLCGWPKQYVSASVRRAVMKSDAPLISSRCSAN